MVPDSTMRTTNSTTCITDLRPTNTTNNINNGAKGSNTNTQLSSSMVPDDERLLRTVYGDGDDNPSILAAAENITLLDNPDISLIDAAGAIAAIGECEAANVDAVGMMRQSSFGGSSGSSGGSTVRKTVEDVWREIVSGRKEYKMEPPDEMMTLEDFLAKVGAVKEEDEDVQAPVTEGLSGGTFDFDLISQGSFGSQKMVQGVRSAFGNEGVAGMAEVVRGKRRAGPLLEPFDKAAQQRQRRMIKNRESAARSRERKQAYQVELESLAAKLEEENEQLLREKVEGTRERFKQLMEKVIPVVERKPARVLKRVRSLEW